MASPSNDCDHCYFPAVGTYGTENLPMCADCRDETLTARLEFEMDEGARTWWDPDSETLVTEYDGAETDAVLKKAIEAHPEFRGWKTETKEDEEKQTCDVCGAVWDADVFRLGQSMNFHHTDATGREEKVMCDTCEDKWLSPENIKQCKQHGECGGHCWDAEWVGEYLEGLDWSEKKIEKFLKDWDE